MHLKIFPILLMLINLSLGATIKVLNFETGFDSQLVIPVDSMKMLRQGFTICFMMKLKNWNDTRIIDSANNLELILNHYKYGAGGTLTIGTSAKHIKSLYNIKTFNTWQPFCMTYDTHSHRSNLFVDGEKILEQGNITNDFGEPFDLGENISFGSSNTYQLRGSLTDLNIWSRPLSDPEITQYSSKLFENVTMLIKPDLIDWTNQVTFQVGSNISVSNIDRRDLRAPGMQARLHVFDEIDGPQTAARHFCQKLGASSPAPRTKAEYNSTFKNGIKIPEFCLDQFWSGIFRSKNGIGNWVYLDESGTETKVEYLPWDHGHPSNGPGEDCVFVGSGFKYQTAKCSIENCFACHFKQQVLFKIRGFPEKEKMDETMFILVKESPDPSNQNFRFQGMGGYMDIVFNKSKSAWELRASNTGAIRGYLDKDVKFPVGLHHWVIGSTADQPLKLIKCNLDEFGCNSGICVPLSKRCNLAIDCDDGSDERSCFSLEFDPNQYIKDDPPVIEGNTTEIQISLDLFLLGSFEEIAMTFKAGFVLKVRWFDYRLTFINLREANNFIEDALGDKIWIPMLSFANSVKSSYLKNDVLATMTIEKLGNGSKRALSYINNEEIYSGNQNPITFSKRYDMTFICEFQLERYPFDSQVCSIKLTIHYELREFATLVPGILRSYMASDKLTQFTVTDKIIEVSEDGDYFTLKILLTRIIFNHLTNTYLPTLTLLIIVEITLFFEESQLQFAIGLTLTILLVMYTLYQGIIQSLPKTAYLKFIDVWLLFCLIIPIAVFLVEVFWELHRVKKMGKANKISSFEPKYTNRHAHPDSDTSKIPFQGLARISFIFVTLAFVVGYAVVSAHHLQNPTYNSI